RGVAVGPRGAVPPSSRPQLTTRCRHRAPSRMDKLFRSDAAFQAGRPREAAAALEEALAAPRASGEAEAAARALQVRSRLAWRLGEGRYVALAAEAVDLLEPEKPGPVLVAACSQLATAHLFAGPYAAAL